MSENYFQHADHFTRILNEQEIHRKSRFSASSSDIKKDDLLDSVEKKEAEVTEDKKNKPIEIDNKPVAVK